MSEKIISTEKLVKRYPEGDGWFTALNNINLTFEKASSQVLSDRVVRVKQRC